jgi:hypothetical protein
MWPFDNSRKSGSYLLDLCFCMSLIAWTPQLKADTIQCFNLDTNPGWTTQGQWAFGVPTGGGSHCYDPASGHTGTNVYGYSLSGDYPDNMPTYRLTTTAINCAGHENVTLSFWQWLGIESSIKAIYLKNLYKED